MLEIEQWELEIQHIKGTDNTSADIFSEQWELEIQHIKGTDNTSADIFSRNPPHCNTTNTTNLRQRYQILVHAIHLNIDNSVKRELKNLAILQNTDTWLQGITVGLTAHSPRGRKYTVNNDVL